MGKPENLKKVTNTKQFEKLVEIMEQNPDIARGSTGFSKTKKFYKQAWKEFGIILNNYGPPLRDGEGWLKVWNDFKNALKRKLVGNKKKIKTTGDGPNKIIPLTKLEEAVDRLMRMQQIVYPCGNTFGPKNAKTNGEINLTSEEDEFIAETAATATSSTITAEIATPTVYKKKTDEKLKLLRKQTKYMKYMEGYMKNIKGYTKQIVDLKKKKFKVYENYLQTKMDMLKRKTENEIRLIELNIQEVSLRLENNQV